MSDRALIPEPHKLYADSESASLTKYRAAFTSLRVVETAAAGRRLTVIDDGRETIFDLTNEQCSFLAALLTGERP